LEHFLLGKEEVLSLAVGIEAGRLEVGKLEVGAEQIGDQGIGVFGFGLGQWSGRSRIGRRRRWVGRSIRTVQATCWV